MGKQTKLQTVHKPNSRWFMKAGMTTKSEAHARTLAIFNNPTCTSTKSIAALISAALIHRQTKSYKPNLYPNLENCCTGKIFSKLLLLD